ncbi:MAG: large repetitive protein [Chloroflexota bacterium]|nr:large repetitive protein [Chloroflexota bacterium]
MTRRLATFVAALTLVASMFGMAAPVAASVAVNAPPVAVDDPAIPDCFTAEFGGSFPLPEDGPQQAFIGVCGATTNDTDSDGTIVAWHVDTPPAHGAIEWLPDHPEVFGYTPNHDWSTLPGNVAGGDWVSDSFTYHVVDDQGASSNEATYRFWIAPINDAPTFTPGPGIVTVRGSAPHSAAWATAVSPGPNEDTQNVHFETMVNVHGTTGLFTADPSIAADGTLSFTPAPGKVGSATVTTYAKDDGGLEHYSGVPDTADDTSDPVTFDIVVQANGSPVAVDDTPPAIDEDAGPITIDVLANDSDPELDPLAIIDVTDGAKGTVAITNSGADLTYAPSPDANGPDTFTYTIDDGHGGTDTATVYVTITPVNDPPAAGADPRLDANCFYPPAQAFALPEDKLSPFTAGGVCNLLANDTDSDGTVVNWVLVTPPQHGQVSNELPLAVPGVSSDFSYTPDPDFFTLPGDVPGGSWVSDSFAYRAVDNDGGVSDPVTVKLWIGPVNDAPTFTAGPLTVSSVIGAAHSAPWATSVDAGPNEGYQTVHFNVDPSPTNGPDLFSVAPTISPTGVLSYTGAPSQTGSATFTVTAQDDGGLENYGGNSDQPSAADTSDPVTLTIRLDDAPPDAVNDTPAAVVEDAGAIAIDALSNDTDPDHDTLTITGVTDGTRGTVAITGGGTGLTYTPNLNADGADTFTYTIDDGRGGTDTAMVSVTIDPVNDAPVAVTDVVTVTEDQTTASTVLVLANDTDVEGDTLTVSARLNGAKGVVAIAAGGASVTYKPNANAFGSDSFTYTVSDGQGGFAIGTVTVTITASNDPPNAVNDGVPTPFKVYVNAGAKAIPVLANDTSLPDSPETLRITKVTQGSHGKVTITGSGTGLTYTPIGTTTGIDVFKYTISDGHGGTDTASVQVTVARDTTAPKATITGLTNKAITGSTKRRLTLTWTFTETQSGIRSELLQRRTDSGSWVTVALSSASVRTASFSMSRGHLYVFRVRATDRSGNVGLFVSRSLRI